LVFFYFAWLFAFLAVKSDSFVDFSWAVAFVPFWLIFCAIWIGFIIGTIVVLCGASHSDHGILKKFAMFFVPGFFWACVVVCDVEYKLGGARQGRADIPMDFGRYTNITNGGGVYCGDWLYDGIRTELM